MPKLIIEDDEGKTVVFPLIRNEISIGRQAGSIICLTDRNVSRRHARLLHSDGHYLLEDLSSYVGTSVNGVRISAPTALEHGDEVTIGNYRLAMTSDQPTLPPRSEGLNTGEVDPTPPPPARLVALTAPLAGQEFVLTAAAMVVGRSPDSDVVIDHPSIEPQHAKILRDGQRYVVIDLLAADGVRVNGDPYRRVELTSGDLVALGRVRLRFATADEPVVLDERKAPALALHLSPRRVLIGAVATAALTVAVVALRSGEHRRVPAPRATAAGPAAVDVEWVGGPAARPEPGIRRPVAGSEPPPLRLRPSRPPSSRRSEAAGRSAVTTLGMVDGPLRVYRPGASSRAVGIPAARERRRRIAAATGAPVAVEAAPPRAVAGPRRRAIDSNDPYAKDRP
jgi:pSer/pThr/pTyr-binding forkhead associated (FHA) protein